jgi:nucleoside-diphosphate-sugar epimerase
MTASPLTGKSILVTGVTGMVAGPVAAKLAAQGNTVYGAARFKEPAQRETHEAAGVRTLRLDLEKRDFAEVPDGLDYVLNFAVARTNDFATDMAANGEGSAALMERCQDVVAFFQCSSAAVYQPNGHAVLAEDAPLGDSHRAAGMESYSISKIVSEALVVHTAARLGIPTVIARLSVPYGDTFGWPFFHKMMIEHGINIDVHPDAPSQFSPLHLDDIVASIPFLLDAAGVPAAVVNWGGDEVVSVEEWCTLIGELIDKPVNFTTSEATIPSIIVDLTKLHDLGFHSTVSWQDGIRGIVEAGS